MTDADTIRNGRMVIRCASFLPVIVCDTPFSLALKFHWAVLVRDKRETTDTDPRLRFRSVAAITKSVNVKGNVIPTVCEAEG